MRGFKIDFGEIEKIINSTIEEYGEKIYNEAMAGLGGASKIRGSFNLVKEPGRVVIYTDNEIAAYIEFGTGAYAKEYLSGKPTEMVEEAMKFFVSGKGRLEAHPYLFPIYYKYKVKLMEDLDKRIQKYFNSL